MSKFTLLLLLVLIIIFIVKKNGRVYELSKNDLKGLAGEQAVNKILKQMKLPYFHDALLVNGNYSNQFDHIVVLKNNTVLVIETKNRAGNIKVPRDPYNPWQQLVGSQTNEFYSPLAQNRGHVNMLYAQMSRAGYPNLNIESIVVFTDANSKILDAPPNVIRLDQLESYLKHKNKKRLFNNSAGVIKTIQKLDQSHNKKLVAKHIERVKKKQK